MNRGQRKAFNLTRLEAIAIIDRATDKDDPYWDWVVQDHYDEESDSMPTLWDVLRALGVTEAECREACGLDDSMCLGWPQDDEQAQKGAENG